MGRRIAFCADGTWDTVSNDTNVYRISKAIAAIPGEQYSFYDDGVGANGTPIEKLLGGAFGAGLFQKIKDGYSTISSVYEAGDEVFIFGFSRGAYTARSLAGMIAACGLPTTNPDPNLVDTAFQAYRNKAQRAAILATLGAYGLVPATMTMVGVWDTVGSLGIPAIFGAVRPLLYGFLDTSLTPDSECLPCSGHRRAPRGVSRDTLDLSTRSRTGPGTGVLLRGALRRWRWIRRRCRHGDCAL